MIRYEIAQIRSSDGTMILRSTGIIDELTMDYSQGLSAWRRCREEIYRLAWRWEHMHVTEAWVLRLTGSFGDWTREYRYNERGQLVYDSGVMKPLGFKVRSHNRDRTEQSLGLTHQIGEHI